MLILMINWAMASDLDRVDHHRGSAEWVAERTGVPRTRNCSSSTPTPSSRPMLAAASFG